MIIWKIEISQLHINSQKIILNSEVQCNYLYTLNVQVLRPIRLEISHN